MSLRSQGASQVQRIQEHLETAVTQIREDPEVSALIETIEKALGATKRIHAHIHAIVAFTSYELDNKLTVADPHFDSVQSVITKRLLEHPVFIDQVRALLTQVHGVHPDFCFAVQITTSQHLVARAARQPVTTASSRPAPKPQVLTESDKKFLRDLHISPD